jgi:hypothetical protein
MNKFEEKKFDIGELKGISKKSIDEHLKLYSGYVKNANTIIDKVNEMRIDTEKNNWRSQIKCRKETKNYKY